MFLDLYKFCFIIEFGNVELWLGKCNFGIVPIDKHLSTKNILTYVHSSVSCVHPKSGEYYCII